MTADWTHAVRERLGLGRLLPLGGPRDGAWISEAAAEAVLRGAAGRVAGVRPGRLRLALADPGTAPEPVVVAPPSALRPGPLRLTADFATTAAVRPAEAEPLPEVAARLRRVLADAAGTRLGLRVSEVDLRATALLDEEPAPAEPAVPPRMLRPGEAGGASAGAEAAAAVPGVAGLTRVLGRAVRIEEAPGSDALARPHARVEIAVAPDHRAVEVARRVREAVSAALPGHPSVAVLVTWAE